MNGYYLGIALILIGSIGLIIYFSVVLINKKKRAERERIEKLRSIHDFYSYRTSMLPVLTHDEINANTIQDFFADCYLIEQYIKEMKEYKYRDNSIEISYNFGIKYKLDEFERVYTEEKQWHLRDVIERHAEKAIDSNKGVYRNSKEHQYLVYFDFIRDIKLHFKELDEETKELFYIMEQKVFDSTDGNILRFVGEEEKPNPIKSEVTLIQNIDNMTGEEFEQFSADILKKCGFRNVRITPVSGDQGVDILAEKDGIKYAIQCKCYSSPLGNKPIQEVHSGKEIYGCHVGVVLTNSTFTDGAKVAAQKTNTLLWDRNKLLEMISRIN